MFAAPIQLLGGIIGFVGFITQWNPDISGGLCLTTICLPWIMFHSGVIIDMRDFVSNYKAIVFRAIVDNFLTLSCVSVGSYYLFPIMGIQSLNFTDHLIMGAVLMPSGFFFNFPPLPFPLIELIDDHSIVFGEGALGISLSLMLLKHVKNLDLVQLTINSRLLSQICGYLTYVLVASSMLGLLVSL
ncbi:hypothetical protein QQ045_025832 [Rhodiola kirilowii]